MARQLSREPARVMGFPAEIHARQEFETIYSYTPALDPDWTYTDNEGHEHQYVESDLNGTHFPTLMWFETNRYRCDLCHEHHTEGELRCKLCGEMIQPGTKRPEPVTIPTRMEIEITVYGDAGEEFEHEFQGERFKFRRIQRTLERGEPVKGLYVATGQIE